MSKNVLIMPFSWQGYSQKLRERILECCHMGVIASQAVLPPEMRLVIGQEGNLPQKTIAKFYLLVDESDGVIADARFQVFGPSVLIGLCETVCELVLRKNYQQAMRVNAEYVEKYLQDHKLKRPLPVDSEGFINLALFALEEALVQCYDIPVEDPAQTPLSDYQEISEEESHPHFLNYTDEEKRRILETIIATEIRPYIELDAGGVEITEIRNQNEVIIRYEGACVSCYSATGATLESIQNILRARVHPSIQVIPDSSVFEQQ